MTEYTTRITSMTVAPNGEPIFSEMATDVRISDDGAGEFVEVSQNSRPDAGKISIDQKEWPALRSAIDEASQIKAAKAMLKAMGEQLARRESRLDRFHAYMADCMKNAGILSVSADGLARATLYLDRDESVELEEGAVFPESLCADPKPLEPSKTKIKLAILAGEEIAGARIIRKDRLTIK